MKLTLLMTAVVMVTAQESFLRGDLSNEVFLVGDSQLMGSPLDEAPEERQLGGLDEDDFKTLYVKYKSKEKKCVLTYKIKGYAQKEIDFGKMEESDDGRSVTCKQSGLDETDGIDLPVEAYGFDATWKEPDGDEVTEFDKVKFKWGTDHKAYVYLKRKTKDDTPDDDGMDEKDFKKIIAKYWSKEKKCTLTYRVKGEDRETIYFGDIEESDDARKVTCKKKVDPTDGIDLPVYADDFDAIWKESGGDSTTEFTETKWKWEKNKKAVLYLERKKAKPKDDMNEDDFKRLIARYKSKEKKCSLTYKVHGEDKKTIWLNSMDESDNGRRVVCRGNESPTDGVWLPVKADGFDAVWKEKGGSSIEVEESMLRWKKNEDITLTLKRSPGGMDADDFDTIKLVYDASKPQHKKCKLIYEVDGKGQKTVWLTDYVKERDGGNKVVCKEYDAKPTSGIDLPVKARDVNAKWFDDKGVKQDVENADVIWDEGRDIKATIYLDH